RSRLPSAPGGRLLALEAHRLATRCGDLTDAAFAREREVMVNERANKHQPSAWCELLPATNCCSHLSQSAPSAWVCSPLDIASDSNSCVASRSGRQRVRTRR